MVFASLPRLSTIVVVLSVVAVSTLPSAIAQTKTSPADEPAANATAKNDDGKADDASAKKSDKAKKSDADGWSPLFNGKDLTGWKSTEFGGEGEVYFEKGNVVITQGVQLSGITSTRKDLPKSNYEVQFEAQRAAGSDFFIGFTFPVKESSCSLICGGWGGGVCGLSSLDGMDAVENETTSYSNFDNGKWYKVRLRVTDDRIEAWLDKHKIVDVETAGHKIGVRFEVDASRPMGFATFQSTGWIRNARMRTLPAAGKAGAKDAQKSPK